VLALAFVPVSGEAAPPIARDAEVAASLSEQAAELSKSGDHRAAARLFHKAYSLDPDPGYLYSAARSEVSAGQWQEAIRDLEAVERVTKPGDHWHRKAREQLAKARVARDDAARAEAARKRDAAGRPAPSEARVPAPTARREPDRPPERPAPKSPVVKPPSVFSTESTPAPGPAPMDSRRRSGIATVVGGSLAAVVGGTLLAVGAARKSAYSKDNPDPNDCRTGPLSTCTDQVSSINTTLYWGWGVLGLGAAAGAVGAALWASAGSGERSTSGESVESPHRVSIGLLPTPGGLTLRLAY